VTELAYLATRNIAQFQEQRRNKLQDAVSGIPPAEQQQEIATALELDKERRLELKSKIDELSTDELERVVVLDPASGCRQNRRVEVATSGACNRAADIVIGLEFVG